MTHRHLLLTFGLLALSVPGNAEANEDEDEADQEEAGEAGDDDTNGEEADADEDAGAEEAEAEEGEAEEAEAEEDRARDRASDEERAEKIQARIERLEEKARDKVGERYPLEETEVAGIDNVFDKASEPLVTVVATRLAIDALPDELAAALDLPEGTPLSDGLDHLLELGEGKVNASLDGGGLPTLEVEEGVPPEVHAAIDSFNDSFTLVNDRVEALGEVPDQIEAVVAEAQNLQIGDLEGVGFFQAFGLPGTIGGNVQTLSKVPSEVEEVQESFTSTVSEVGDAFGAES